MGFSALGCGPEFSVLRPRSFLYYIQQKLGLVRAAPPPALLAAGPNADARFLVQTKYGYEFDPAFVGPMGKAIEKARDSMLESLAAQKPVTADDVFAWMDSIAATRAEIAASKGDADSIGRPQRRKFEDGPNQKYREVFTQDVLSPDPDHFAYRHAPFFEQAVKVAREQESLRKSKRKYSTMTAFGKTYPASNVIDAAGGRAAVVFHPPDGESIPMRIKAAEELAKALSSPTITEAEFMETAAQSYALFMQANPYERGSPSIVESFLDASLRAKFGKTLGRKTAEPFWEVVLRVPGQAPFNGTDLMRCFGGGAIQEPEK